MGRLDLVSRPDLTPKQAAFVREYVKCGNASEAYKLAYDSRNMQDDTIRRRASELLGHSDIGAAITAIQARAAERVGITLAAHLERLEHLSNVAESLEQIGTSVKAEELRGKVSGLYVERVEHSSQEPVIVTFRLDRPHGETPEED